MQVPIVVPIFLIISAIFFTLAIRDRLREGLESNPARKTWFRVAVIFCAVAIFLIIWHYLTAT